MDINDLPTCMEKIAMHWKNDGRASYINVSFYSYNTSFEGEIVVGDNPELIS